MLLFSFFAYPRRICLLTNVCLLRGDPKSILSLGCIWMTSAYIGVLILRCPFGSADISSVFSYLVSISKNNHFKQTYYYFFCKIFAAFQQSLDLFREKQCQIKHDFPLWLGSKYCDLNVPNYILILFSCLFSFKASTSLNMVL